MIILQTTIKLLKTNDLRIITRWKNPLLVCKRNMHTGKVTIEELKYQTFIDECLENKVTFTNILIESQKAFGDIMPSDFFLSYIHKIRLDLESIQDREYYWTKYGELLDLDDLLLFDYQNNMTLKDDALSICQTYIDDFIHDYLSSQEISDTYSDTSLDPLQDNALYSAYEDYFNSLSPAKYLILYLHSFYMFILCVITIIIV